LSFQLVLLFYGLIYFLTAARYLKDLYPQGNKLLGFQACIRGLFDEAERRVSSRYWGWSSAIDYPVVLVWYVVVVGGIIGLLLFFLGLAALYITARLFLVVEAFISVRSMRLGVYVTVDWASYIPHL
jgi:hypothetical protein